MKWSWRIGAVAGIEIYIHATFLILLAWIALAGWLAGQSVALLLDTLVFISAIFACIVVHELGHALTARRFGIRTRDITLLPIGGLSRLERMPEQPRQELLVALAGPCVNLVIAAVLWTLLWLTDGFVDTARWSAMEGPFLQRLLVVNLILMTFNLLPAFPMDGGRALRAMLATRMDYAVATQRAAHVGQAMALAFGLVGLLVNPVLIFIALFVWIGAASEAGLVQITTALAGIPVANAMLTDFEQLGPRDALDRAVELTLSGSQRNFPVVDAGVVVGILTQERLIEALSTDRAEVSVADVMQPSEQPADPHEMLDTVLARLDQASGATLPVVRAGRLVGILTTENVGEFLRIQAALARRPGSPRALRV